MFRQGLNELRELQRVPSLRDEFSVPRLKNDEFSDATKRVALAHFCPAHEFLSRRYFSALRKFVI